MEPRFIEKNQIRLVGIIATGKPDEITQHLNDIWMNQFMKFDEALKPYSLDKAYYGAWIGEAEGNTTYIAGMAVEQLPEIPAGLGERMLPAAKYAVFDCQVKTIGDTYGEIYCSWLPKSAFEYDTCAVDFEFYPADTETSDSPTQVYIPVKEKMAQPD